MIETIVTMWSYPFLRRALAAGFLVSLCAGLLGTALVPRRFAHIGNSLSNAGFAACAVAMGFGWAPLYISLPVVTLAAFVLFWLEQRGRLSGDAATAVLSTGSLAFGALVLSLTTGLTTDVCNYLFGSILSMSRTDELLSFLLCGVVAVLFIAYYPAIFSVTFDSEFARAAGLPVKRIQLMLSVLTAVTVVLGMRMMGTLLIASLILFPALAAMRICRRFLSMTLCAALFSGIGFLAGMYGSYVFSTPTGASIVLADLALYALCALAGLARGKEK
jgi:ABC-type Mn2+/Zn2+ transport system permease subunit